MEQGGLTSPTEQGIECRGRLYVDAGRASRGGGGEKEGRFFQEGAPLNFAVSRPDHYTDERIKVPSQRDAGETMATTTHHPLLDAWSSSRSEILSGDDDIPNLHGSRH